VSWAELATMAARAAGFDASLVDARPHSELGFVAPRPANAALGSERGSLLPSLENALARYVAERGWEQADEASLAGASEGAVESGAD
jgi:dTDP-4-dehydrorhamnose reductase